LTCNIPTGILLAGEKMSKAEKTRQYIIEQAASAAAYFSRAKNSAIVPVNYTRVKYVRRQRKSPPGTVIISNEKTIFVKPKKFI